jgi:hypothetical protein
MAKKKEMIIIFMFLPLFILAMDKEANSVYIKSETPYLYDVSLLLEKHDYILQSDSLKANYVGSLFFYREQNDSIRCELQLQKDDESPFILDSFTKEPVKTKSVRESVYKFTIWMLILNAITTILFFLRSS